MEKNIYYRDRKCAEFSEARHKLDVFYPESSSGAKQVFIFIHGGSWSEGNKDLYSPLGRIMLEKDVITVIINYRLAPAADYAKMASDCAVAVLWVNENIKDFGGDPGKIFLLGHSAGGHLAALITLNPEYYTEFNGSNPVKGCILLDAFGLNVYTFLSEHRTPYNHLLHKVFTDDPEQWKRGAPEMYLQGNKVPFLVIVGSNTYPFLMMDNGMFVQKMEAAGQDIRYELVEGKSHYQMVSQLENSSSPVYETMLAFTRMQRQ